MFVQLLVSKADTNLHS